MLIILIKLYICSLVCKYKTKNTLFKEPVKDVRMSYVNWESGTAQHKY